MSDYMDNALPLRKKESHIDVSRDGELGTQDEKGGKDMRIVRKLGQYLRAASGKIDKNKNDNGKIPTYPQAP